MKRLIHRCAAITATLTIACFFLSSLTAELMGSPEQVAQVKHLIVFPGLFILIPAMALTGATGFAMGHSGKRIDQKKKRMRIAGINGVLVLLPAALYLNHLASAGLFNQTFYLIQALELMAGAINLSLMAMNIRDGLRMSSRPSSVLQ